MSENKDFCPVILRQGTVYGLSPRMRYDLVVNVLVKKAFETGRMTAFCGGSQWRPLVDVKDVARAHVACLEAEDEKVRGQIYNVVYENFQILDLAHRIKSAIKDIVPVEIDVDYDDARFDRSYKISNVKFKEALRFDYGSPVEDSARRIALHIKGHLDDGGKIGDLDHPRYYNIKWMEHLVDMEQRLKDMGGSVF